MMVVSATNVTLIECTQMLSHLIWMCCFCFSFVFFFSFRANNRMKLNNLIIQKQTQWIKHNNIQYFLDVEIIDKPFIEIRQRKTHRATIHFHIPQSAQLTNIQSSISQQFQSEAETMSMLLKTHSLRQFFSSPFSLSSLTQVNKFAHSFPVFCFGNRRITKQSNIDVNKYYYLRLMYGYSSYIPIVQKRLRMRSNNHFFFQNGNKFYPYTL